MVGAVKYTVIRVRKPYILTKIGRWATDPAPVLQLSDGRKRKLAVQTPVDAEQCSQITPHLKRIPQEKVGSFDIRLQDAWQKFQSLQTRQQSSESRHKGSNVQEPQTLRYTHSTSPYDAPLWPQSLKIASSSHDQVELILGLDNLQELHDMWMPTQMPRSNSRLVRNQAGLKNDTKAGFGSVGYKYFFEFLLRANLGAVEAMAKLGFSMFLLNYPWVLLCFSIGPMSIALIHSPFLA